MHRPPISSLLLAAAVAGAFTGAPPAAAETTDTSPPRIQGITFSRTSVAVSGLNLVPVRVAVHLTDTSGVAEVRHGMNPSPALTLGSVPGFQSKLRPVLTRTSGTPTDGVWSATVYVPSTWSGTVRVTSLNVVDTAGNERTGAVTGVRAPTLRVRGTHRPVLTINYAPLPGGGYRIHGRASFADTGRPLSRRALATANDSGCDFAGGAVDNIVTDRNGRYEKRWPGRGEGEAGCVALIGRAAPAQLPTVLAYRRAAAPFIPDAAMLQPEDLRGAMPTPVTADIWPELRPPRPCQDRPYPSSALRQAEKAVSVLIGVGERPTVVMEHVATYRGDGARRYLRDLRRGVAACDPAEWSLIGTGVAGDESVLLRQREYVDYAETWKTTYVLVARVGGAVVVLADTGWEAGSGHEHLVRDLAGAAVRRAAIL